MCLPGKTPSAPSDRILDFECDGRRGKWTHVKTVRRPSSRTKGPPMMIEVWKLNSRDMLEHKFLNEWLNFAKFLEEAHG
jgi:hypothetical protein